FRHLAYKTQVLVYDRNNMYRTRMTHSLEVSQISRSVARILGLNTVLCEAIALAHDLGHAPFGHAGETVLNELMADKGGFEHNFQSLRVVDKLERKFPDYPGMNLTYATREGIIRHVTEYDRPDIPAEFRERNSTLETETICIADRISFNTHDIEDAFIEGLIDIDDMCKKIDFLGKLKEQVNKKYPSLKGLEFVYRWKSLILKEFVSNVIANSLENLRSMNIRNFTDVENVERSTVVSLTDQYLKIMRELEIYLLENVYTSNIVVRMKDKAAYIIKELFNRYMKNIKLLPEYFFKLYIEEEISVSPERVVCDFIAMKSDQSIIREYNILFNPVFRVF
ncbi:MAG: HD domain-containing protein, partial [Actinomycetia bacterium]|nr:HD domain-containing protein [Actinomycetes bacterium]